MLPHSPVLRGPGRARHALRVGADQATAGLLGAPMFSTAQGPGSGESQQDRPLPFPGALRDCAL